MTIQGAGEPVLSDNKTGVLEIVCYFWMAMLEMCIITVLFLSDDINVNFWLKCDFLGKVKHEHIHTLYWPYFYRTIQSTDIKLTWRRVHGGAHSCSGSVFSQLVLHMASWLRV